MQKDDRPTEAPPGPGKDHRRAGEASKRKDTSSQGIVRDQRGQEQPADKERAQRVSQSDDPGG